MGACVIIVSYRTGPALSECLASVADAADVEEIMVIDNGNAPAEIAAIDRLTAATSKAQVLRGQGNVGFAKACNLGAARARADVLVFLNPDATLAPGAVSQLSAALAAAPPPAIVGGDLRDSAGRPDRGSRRERLTTWRAFVSVSGLSRWERWFPALRDLNRHTDPLPPRASRVSCISGALFAMRKTDFESIGGLDEAYFMHVDDVEISGVAENALSTGRTGGLSVRMPAQTEAQASGGSVRVIVRAFGAADGGQFGVAYSTNDMGNSGWIRFPLSRTPADYVFVYAVPVMRAGNGDFLAFRSYGNASVSIVGFKVEATPAAAPAASAPAQIRTTTSPQ